MTDSSLTIPVPDRVRGILFGLAAGDRIGGPTAMGLLLAESLLARGTFDPADLLARWRSWWGGHGSDAGPVAAKVFTLIEQGLTSAEAVQQVDRGFGGLTAGCNPSHRVSPMAMAGFLSDEALPVAAMLQARLTHFHPLAADGAVSIAMMTRALLRDADWAEVLDTGRVGAMPETATALAATPRSALKPEGVTPDVLAAAVWFTGNHGSFEAALTASLAFAGPANYAPVLVGVLGGARWGRAAIPAEHISHLRPEVLARVEKIAEAMVRTWGVA